MTQQPATPTTAADHVRALRRAGSATEAAALADTLLAKAPGDAALLDERHRCALALADRAGAIGFLRRAVAVSGRQRYLASLAELLAKTGAAAEARDLLTRAIGKRTDQPRLLATLATVSLALDDELGASRAYALACAAAPAETRWQLARGRLALKLGDLKTAVDAFASAAADPALCGRAERGAARVAKLAADPVARARHLAGVAARYPDHVATALALAEAEVASGRQDAAIAALERHLAAGDATAPQVLIALAKLQRAARQYDAERETLERLVALRPGKPQFWLMLARATRASQGVESELELLKRAEASACDPRLFVRHIQLLLDHGHVADAEDVMAHALALHPNAATLIALIALHKLRLGQWAEADALANLPGAAGVRLQLAAVQAERRGALDAAMATLEQAAAAAPTAWRIHESEARIALQLLDVRLVRAAFAAVAASQTDGRAKRQPRHVLRQLAGEMRVHAEAVERGREALAAGDVAGLMAALADEPGSTVLANALLRFLQGRACPGRSAPSTSAIPCKLYQFWDSPAPPRDVLDLIESWRAAHPDWEMRLYDTRTARAYIAARGQPEWLRAWRYARQSAQRADLLRLILLHEEGGVYADADDRCLAPIDGLIAGVDFLAGQESYGSVGNNLLAAAPGHPIIRRALHDAVAASLSGGAESIWLRTGPGALSRALALHLAEDPARLEELGGGIQLLPQHELTPFVWSHCKPAYKRRGATWQKSELG